MKYLTVKDLIKELSKYDGDLPVIITDAGKDHQYGINDEDIKVVEHAYFGNDIGAEEAFSCYNEETGEEIDMNYLNLGYF